MMANVSWFQERTSLSIPERSPRWGRSTPIRRDSSTSLVASDDLEKQSNVYFIDLWALRTHQLKANDHVHVVGSSYDEITLFALDQDEKIKVYDFVGLQKKEFFDYEYFLTSADEMNLIIKGYQDLPVQEAYAPQRMNEQKITNDLLPITSFFDPPVDFVLSKDYAFFIYKKKVIIYRRSELLTLGKLKDFDKMKASRSQFNYIVWEFEIGNKQVQRAYLTKDDSLVLLLDVGFLDS
jgi:hypothetical protein